VHKNDAAQADSVIRIIVTAALPFGIWGSVQGNACFFQLFR
jgi:hypothetical protein